MSSTDTGLSLLEKIAAKRAASMGENTARATQWRSTLERIADAKAVSKGVNRQRQDRKVWEKILDVLSTGNYASAGLAMAIKRGDPDVWQSIVQGVKDRTSYIDVAREFGVPGKAAIPLGLLGDIFLDPTTYIPGFGATAKGKVVKEMMDEMAHVGLVGAGKVAQQEWIAKYVNAMPNRKEQEIARRAVLEGEKTLYARKFPERVEAGLQRMFTVERPTGVFVIPKTRLTRFKIPTPIPKFETLGFNLPFPKTIEVGVAKAIDSVGLLVSEAPGIRQVRQYMGDKFFGAMVRPEGANPVLWESFTWLHKQFRRRLAGRLTALNDALSELGSTPNISGEKLQRLGIDPEGQEGELFKHIFREAFVNNWSAEQKRALLLLIEEPERVLHGKEGNVAETIMNDIFVKRPSDTHFRAVITGKPEDMTQLIESAQDVRSLQEAETKIQRGIIYTERALQPYRQGARMLEEADYPLMQKQMQDLEAGLEQVRERMFQLAPPKPIEAKFPGIQPDFIPRPPPQIDPSIPTRWHGTGQDAMAFHATQVAKLQQLRERMGQVIEYGMGTGSPGRAENAKLALERMTHEGNKISNVLAGVEQDMLQSQRRAEESKRLGEEMGTAVQREVQAIRKGPAMRTKAAEVLPEARQELADLEAQISFYERSGDEAKAAEVMDRFTSLQNESLGTRLARLTQDQELGVLEQRGLAKEYAQAGQKHQFRAFREARGPEALYLEAAGPPGAIDAAQRTARVLGTDLRGLQQLAATTTPMEFQARVLGSIQNLAAQEVNQIGEDVLSAVSSADLGEMHGLLREAMGLPPSTFGLQLADLGLSEPEAMTAVTADVERALDRLRNTDPTSRVQLESVHVIGSYAKGQGQVGQPVDMLAFVDTDLDESTVAVALQQRMNLAGAMIPTEVSVMPFRMVPGLTKDEVLRAFGAAPPLTRAEPELFPSLAAPEVPPSVVAVGPVPKVAITLQNMRAQPPTKAIRDLIPIRKRAEQLIERGKVLRTRKSSPSGSSSKYHKEMREEFAQTRRRLDTWEKNHYAKSNNFEKVAYERTRRELNRYDPELLTADGVSARIAKERTFRKQKRIYKILNMRPAAPMDASGMPIVNTGTWSDEAKQFLKIDRANAMEVIDANRSALKPGGTWIEYENNGNPTGKQLSDDEFLGAYSKLSNGQARTIAIKPEGIELDRAWHEVRFDPQTHTLEIADDAGLVYQRQLDIPLNPEAYPPSVRLATEKIRVTYPDGAIANYDGFDAFHRDFMEKFGADERLAQTTAEAGKETGLQQLLKSISVETIGKTAEAKPARIKIRPEDLGLGAGPGGWIPRLVGQYKPWGHFRVGEFISLEGVPGQVISSPAQGIRRVQLQTGQVVDVHAGDLKLATLRDIARNDHSVVDFLMRAAMRPDGSVDMAHLKTMIQGMERDALLSSHIAENLTENLVTDMPVTPELLMAKEGIKSLLEGMWTHENAVGILVRHLNFYSPRALTENAAKRKMRLFGSMPPLRMTQPMFAKNRKTVSYTMEQMKKAFEAIGIESPWVDDIMVALGFRGTASVKYTETARFLSESLTKFGKRVDSHVLDAAMDGYEGILRDVYNFPEERISKIKGLVDELVTLEGYGVTGAQATGRGARGFLTEEGQAEHLRRIEQIRADLNELAPPFSFVVPKGAVAHYNGAMDGVTADILAEDAVLSADQVQAMGALTQNAAMYDGSQLMEIPLDKVWTIRSLPKDVPAYILPKEIADAINGNLSNFADIGEDLNQFLRVFDIFQNYWKSWTLAIFPAYHFRNLVGNMWNMFLAGGLDPERMGEGGRFFSGNLNDFKDRHGRLISQEELANEMYDGNLLRHGEYTIETRQTPEGEIRQTTIKPIPLKGIVDQLRGQAPKKQIALAIGERIGQRNEDWAKVSLYLDGRYKGMSPEVAAERVHKYLFDYDALGTVEKQIMPRLFPFYRWSRFNIPLQLQALMTRPAKFTGAYKGIKAIREYVGEPPEEKLLPQWMQDQVPIPIKKLANGKYGYWVLGNWLPAADLVRAMDPAAMAGGMLTPIIKTPYEYATNYSLFFKNQVERFPKETGQFLGLELRQRDINLLRNIRTLNEVDKLAFKKELPFGARVVRTVLGRIYPVDYIQQAEFELYSLNREASAVTTSLVRAQKAYNEAMVGGNSFRAYQLKKHISVLQSDLRELNAKEKALRVVAPKKTAMQRRREKQERKMAEIGAGL